MVAVQPGCVQQVTRGHCFSTHLVQKGQCRVTEMWAPASDGPLVHGGTSLPPVLGADTFKNSPFCRCSCPRHRVKAGTWRGSHQSHS